MAMSFEELDETTRRCMLEEFEAEMAGDNPYCGRNLSLTGRELFPELMSQAIKDGNEKTLMAALNRADLWNPTERRVTKGVVRQRRINVRQQSERLALTEFNTWYVRGLARRLLDEGETQCQVYRAAVPKWRESPACREHEREIMPLSVIYEGHRARYWPTENLQALSIPFAPNCHHTIRRVG